MKERKGLFYFRKRKLKKMIVTWTVKVRCISIHLNIII